MGISSPPPLADSNPQGMRFSPVPDSLRDRESGVQNVPSLPPGDGDQLESDFDDDEITGEFDTRGFIDEYESQLETLRAVASQQALDVSNGTQNDLDIEPEPPTLRKRPAFVTEKQFQSQPERPLRELPEDFDLSSEDLADD